MTTLQPLRGNIVVKPIEAMKQTASGILIPDSSTEKPEQGTVIAVGSGKILPDGSILPMEITVGANIVYHRNTGQKVKIDGEEYLIMKEEDLLAVVS